MQTKNPISGRFKGQGLAMAWVFANMVQWVWQTNPMTVAAAAGGNACKMMDAPYMAYTMGEGRRSFLGVSEVITGPSVMAAGSS